MNYFKIILVAFTFCAVIFSGPARAQKYKTAADTIKLNKEFKDITSDIAELNTKLTAAKNKTSGYQDKTDKTSQDAQTAAEQSKEQAAVAAGGNIKDIKKELKKAKKANNDANDAKDAANDQKANEKEIKYLNAQIAKKQSKLDELTKERGAIMSLAGTTTN
jgi:chromosome segregation ATPase